MGNWENVSEEEITFGRTSTLDKGKKEKHVEY